MQLAPGTGAVISGPDRPETNLRRRADDATKTRHCFFTRPISLILSDLRRSCPLSGPSAVTQNTVPSYKETAQPMRLRHDPVYPSRRSPVRPTNVRRPQGRARALSRPKPGPVHLQQAATP